MLHQYPANAPPLQVMLDLVGDESETAVILLQSNALVEVGATFELAQPKSAQDPHVVAELRSTVRKRLESESGSSTAVPRTAGELRGRARAIRLCRERIEANKASEERRRQIEAAEKVRQTRLEAIRRRGESAWQEVEDEIERRNSSSYDRAAALLTDLRALAEKQGTIEDFLRRLHEIRGRHVRKERFIKRLAAIG